MHVLQIYIGLSRRMVIQNQDDLQVGMLVAIKGQSFPQVGTVLEIPPNATMDTSIGVQWMKQEKAAHKPKWSRFFHHLPLWAQ